MIQPANHPRVTLRMSGPLECYAAMFGINAALVVE